MAGGDRKAPQIRRIVTSHDAAGKAVVWIDGPATNHRFPEPEVTSTLIWVTDEAPADYTGDADAGQRVLGTAPPAGGTRFCVIEFQPGNESHMHRTDTIDYVICMSGEIDIELDESTVHMKAGDILVQRGTNHSWVNRGTAPARLAFVLLDGKPKRAGSVSGAQEASKCS